MVNITRSKLIGAIAHRFPQLDGEDVELAARILLQAMSESLRDGSRIEIRGFGSFKLKSQARRTGRNPRTGVKVDIPAKNVPHFKAFKELALRVNETADRTTHLDLMAA